jgi:hypothetical protein
MWITPLLAPMMLLFLLSLLLLSQYTFSSIGNSMDMTSTNIVVFCIGSPPYRLLLLCFHHRGIAVRGNGRVIA